MPKTKKAPVKKAKSSGSTAKAQPKKESGEPTAAEKAQAFVKTMTSSPKFRGKVQVRSAQDYRTPYYLRRPTGILGLDIALGGGFPAGGSSQIYGARSSGKTHMCFNVAAQVQKHYGKNAIIALGVSELRADVGFARMSGFCVAYSDQQIDEYEAIRVKEGRPKFTAEEKADLRKQIGEIIFLQGATGADMLDSTIEVLENLGSDCQLMIVDSLGSLLTPEQDTKSVGDKHYGGSSGLLTLWQTKVQPRFILDRADGSMLETTILGINQVRARIGAPTPSDRPAAGAKSWEHAQLINLELKQGEPLWVDSKHTRQSGRVIKWAIKKGKAGSHDGSKGEFDWYYFPDHDPVFWKDVEAYGTEYGADKITDVVETAKKLGVITVNGAWLSFLSDKLSTVRAQGAEGFAEKVFNDPDLEAELREQCLRTANLTVRYR